MTVVNGVMDTLRLLLLKLSLEMLQEFGLIPFDPNQIVIAILDNLLDRFF